MSKLILVLAAVFALVFAFVDTVWLHGHWSDARLAEQVRSRVEDEPYLLGREPIEVSVEHHQVVLEGNVARDGFRRDLGKSALDVPGVRAVVNNVQSLNEPALVQLTELLAGPPTSLEVRYQVRDDGTVLLTGPVEDEALQQRIENMAAAVAGVEAVESDWTTPGAQEVELALGEIMRRRNIYFDFNLATIRQDSREALDEIATVLSEAPDYRVRIEGHTDSIGSDAYNLDLSQRRSDAVRDALVERGIAAGRLETIGYGETRPVASNDSPETRAENRRIEFRVFE